MKSIVLAVFGLFLALFIQPTFAVEDASWGNVKGQFSDALAEKPVVSSTKAGGRREISPCSGYRSGGCKSETKGEFVVSMDPGLSPPFHIVEAGSLNVPITALRFVGSYEPIDLRQIGFRSDSPDIHIYTNPCAMTRFTVWHEGQQVGEGSFPNGNFFSVTLSKDVIIPADGQEILIIKANSSPIGDGYCAKSGDVISINYDGEHPENTWGFGKNSATRIISSSNSSSTSYGIRIESIVDMQQLLKELYALVEQALDTTQSLEQLATTEMQIHLLFSWIHNWHR